MRYGVREILNKMKAQKTSHEVLPTGFVKMDRHLDGGFFLKELIILGANTGVGKSQIASQMLSTISSEGFKSAYFSLEISNEMLISRLVGIKTNIKPTMVRFGNLSASEHKLKSDAELDLVTLGDLINFYDDTYLLDEICAEVKKNEYEFVVIDFIQNIMDRVTDEYSRMSKAAITLQKLAKDVGCTILVLSQLSNTAAKEGRKSKNIEYKGSGSIAMVADLGFILERDEDGLTELTLRKNRRGISGVTLNLGFKSPGGLMYEK